jgi:hypothetical protein
MSSLLKVNSAKYFPAILDSYRKIPLNEALQRYQTALIARIETIRAEVASNPSRFSALPPAIALAAAQKEQRAKDRELQWKAILQAYKTSLADSKVKRKPEEEWQRQLGAQAHKLNQKKALRKAAVFLDRLAGMQFIQGKEQWRAAIEAAIDAPVSHEDLNLERLVAKRDAIERELGDAFLREMQDLAIEITKEEKNE